LGRFVQIAAHEDAADTVFAQQPLREVLAGFSIRQSKVHERQVRTRLRHDLPATREILDRAKNGMLKLFDLHLKIQGNQKFIFDNQDIHRALPGRHGDLNLDAIPMLCRPFLHRRSKLANNARHYLRTETDPL